MTREDLLTFTMIESGLYDTEHLSRLAFGIFDNMEDWTPDEFFGSFKAVTFTKAQEKELRAYYSTSSTREAKKKYFEDLERLLWRCTL